MSNADHEILRQVAEAVRECCIDEARKAFEQGGISGLCVEGRWDLAMDRLRSLDLESIVHTALTANPPSLSNTPEAPATSALPASSRKS